MHTELQLQRWTNVLLVGTAGESSGFKYGFFENTVTWIEIVLPNGEVVDASPKERSDLFHGAAGTFGTLGVTTLLELSLIDSKRYVELTYHPTTNFKDSLATLKYQTELKTNDYVDGIIFSADRGVIITGRLTDDRTTGLPLQRITRAQDPWHYVHADRATRGRDPSQPVQEVTPVRDYFFRYDRGAFWTGRYAFHYFFTPFNRITRYLLDWYMHTRVMYHALHESGHAKKCIIQDLLLPEDTAEDFLEYLKDNTIIMPLWLCPFTVDKEISLHPRLPDGPEDGKVRKFVNIGAWGPGPYHHDRFVAVHRAMEDKVRELGGMKWLYGQNYYTEAEFDDIYDREWYDALRAKYDATYLPTVYDKVKTDLTNNERERTTWVGYISGALWDWPFSGLYGVMKAISARDYLLGK